MLTSSAARSEGGNIGEVGGESRRGRGGKDARMFTERTRRAASCALWLEKNVSALITSRPARRWTKFEKTTSKPFSVSRTL